MGNTIQTIGHSTHSIEEFIAILKAQSIDLVVDVRSLPGSRRYPQFNQERLEASLKETGIDYLHLKELGGLRHAAPDSVNTAWKNASFRGFADYMQTEEFHIGILALLELGKKTNLAVMCAEAVPWRCHRSLIADSLTVHGMQVIHILGKDSSQPHRMTPWAKVDGLEISYPGELDRQIQSPQKMNGA